MRIPTAGVWNSLIIVSFMISVSEFLVPDARVCKSPKSEALPFVAMATKSISFFIVFGPTKPPQNTPLVGEATPSIPVLETLKFPKSAASPAVAIVKTSITFCAPPAGAIAPPAANALVLLDKLPLAEAPTVKSPKDCAFAPKPPVRVITSEAVV